LVRTPKSERKTLSPKFFFFFFLRPNIHYGEAQKIPFKIFTHQINHKKRILLVPWVTFGQPVLEWWALSVAVRGWSSVGVVGRILSIADGGRWFGREGETGFGSALHEYNVVVNGTS
jgi:hypothetical protein